ncbi:uncharacterized protein K452DRAFT_362686 [Aplosporella prunicola CBS 121167]|uniref:Uncharacterized protein n=1 Tax=Aplosporella prunicola CBS 121167 TaxID=1176127 RepID=A0A6A6B0H3_9PEZI|nr:uncharacterized protein K452DRAFT_362686 [Aplosporella prunicola CBS 121167]KAF2136211.1 hypothetical protein K452DRAFT_362686 [Aplosporella prunicola CBS 121167]
MGDPITATHGLLLLSLARPTTTSSQPIYKSPCPASRSCLQIPLQSRSNPVLEPLSPMLLPRGVVAAAVAAVLLQAAQPVSAGLFDVDFDLNPAPGAENALRDRSRLPAQICAIIAAYIGCVVIVGVALLTYGRKMRRSINEKIDMVKVNEANGFEMTPVSPSMSMRRWWPRSPSKLSHAFQRSRSSLNQISSLPTSPISPGEESMASFDKTFLRDQQEARQREMDRLYAAVMEHDERKNSVRVSHAEEHDLEQPREDVMLPAPPTYLSPQQKMDRRPPPLNTNAAAALQSRPVHHHQPPPPPSPLSPVRAIYPPESPMAAARRAPYNAPSHYYSNSYNSATSNTAPAPAAPPPPASPRSFMSRARTPSTSSTGTKSKSKKRRSIRNLRISSPMARFSGHGGDNGHDDDDLEARTPLSPRFYNPGPPPQPPYTPADAQMTPGAATTTTSTAPTTPSTADAFRYEFDASLQSQSHPYPYPPPAPLPLPRPAPQRAVSGASAYAGARASSGSLGLPPSPSPASANAPPLPPSPASTPGPHSHGHTHIAFLASPPPARPGLGAGSRSASARSGSINTATAPSPASTTAAAAAGAHTTTTNTLPLRAMAGPLSPSLPSPTTKTTVLSTRSRDPRLAHLRTPGTAGPATPYSPYMPFSPVTPVTPHLVTREERRERRKREKRGVGVAEEGEESLGLGVWVLIIKMSDSEWLAAGCWLLAAMHVYSSYIHPCLVPSAMVVIPMSTFPPIDRMHRYLPIASSVPVSVFILTHTAHQARTSTPRRKAKATPRQIPRPN